MAVRNLQKIFRPKRIAVIGSSCGDDRVASAVLRNLRSGGFEGEISVVHSERGRIEGFDAVRNVAELPEIADLALVCGPAEEVPRTVRECGDAGIDGLLVMSGGFRETGPAGQELERLVLREASRFDGLRVLGPRSIGILVPHLKLNASLVSAQPRTGRVAFVSQSGTLCTSALDWAIEEEIGFSHFVSMGNSLDVTVGDLIDYLAADPYTDSIILFLESISEARQFMSAARAITKEKPIVVYKAGRFSESAAATVTHTGTLAGVDAVYEAAFERAGIVRVAEIDDMFDCAELLGRSPRPTGPRLAIITNAGGPGIVAVDSLISCKGSLARLSDETLRRLNEFLPAHWSHANPVDIQGEAQPDRFARAIDIVLSDSCVDAALVILTPQAVTEPTATAEVVARIARRSHKPILAAWMGGHRVRAGIHVLHEAGVPTYTTPKNAVHAFMHLVTYTRNKETLYETPRELPAEGPVEREKQHQLFDSIRAVNQEVLSEAAAKGLLQAYGIAAAQPSAARTPDEAVGLARRLGYPVVLKIDSPQITHKNEVGGIALNLSSDDEVRGALQTIVNSVKTLRPGVDVEGVTVQPMITAPDSFEMILGSRKDPVFGSVIVVGTGGIAAEVLEDFALGLPPLNDRLARRMLESLRSWPILAGYRNRPAVNIDSLIQAIIRFSHLIADCPEIGEFDVNPLLVSPRDVIALDARIRVDRKAAEQPARRFAHLAIRPYPDELVQTHTLKDQTEVLLRPIKPEDEPLWHEMLAGCSQQSIRFRFRYLFQAMSHEMAARYCFIDYDRELAIVAEIERSGKRDLIAVAHLVCDADHRLAEYAVLVADAWQGRGLGNLLTEYCLKIAGDWELDEVVGETEPTNQRMIATFRRYGFELKFGTSFDDPVVALKKLASNEIVSQTS